MPVAVLGDVGGQPDRLRAALKSLGGNVDAGEMPENTQIVQVGDLIRVEEGLETGSLEVVEMVDAIRRRTSSWFQLWGNHDLAALGGDRMPRWTGQVDSAATRLLAQWWQESFGRVAVAVNDTLITHAGLTLGALQALQLSPDASPAEVADALNQSATGGCPADLGRGGRSVTGTTALGTNCVWAEFSHELSDPWVEFGMMPFDQIHGHSGAFNHKSGQFRLTLSERVRSQTTVDTARRSSEVSVGNRSLRTVDTGLVNDRGETLPVLLLEGTVV